jgi:hypothetical protein
LPSKAKGEGRQEVRPLYYKNAKTMKKYNNKTKHIISFLFLSLLLFIMIFPIIQVQAQEIVPDGPGTIKKIINGEKVEESIASKKEEGAYKLSDFTVLMVNVATWILGISGSLALLAFIVGGLIFLTSAGNKEKVEQAKKILSGAVIGLAIVFFSYVVINFILSTVFPNYQTQFGDWNQAPISATPPPHQLVQIT